MQTIKRLPKSVHSSLRSSIILSDLPRVVEELIYNSIDAKAKKIDISVNVRACYVRVEDDGCGITRDELVLLGEKYATSKFHDIVGDGESISRSFGSNDEALASLSDISVVEVRTKARGRPNSYCKIIKGSKCSHLGIDDQREAVGTTVVVRELFYNQPVRRKQMQSSQKRELHHVKKCVLQIALIHPQVSVRLLDIGSEDELLYTVPSSSPLPLISNSFGDDVSSCLHEIATSDQNWALSGHISGPKDVFCTKDFQYLYVNSRFVSRSPIHSILNNVAATLQSSIIRMNEQIDVQSRKRQKIDVYPAYLLNLCCPRSSYDLHFEPSKCIVEFKDWQSILSFIERTITNYWKMPVPQSSKGVTIDGSTCVPLKGDVKSSQGLLKHHSAQNKEDDAGLYQRSLQKDTGRENNIDKNTATLPKDLHSFSFDMEPSTWDVCYSDRINDASQHSDDVAKNKRIVGHKQTYSPARVSCQWLEYDPSQLEDYDISGASPTVRKKQRTEGIFHRNAYSCNFGTLEDVQTKGLLADDQDSEIICPEIQLQEPCFGVINTPNRITYDFTPSETNMKANILDCDGFHLEFDKLNEDRLLNEDGIACSDMSHFSNGFYHEDFSTSRDFCSVMKRCSGRDGLATVQGYVEGLEANTIDQVNFPDIQAVWGSDSMDRSSIKDIYLHFSYPFSSVDTPLSHSHAATDLELHGRSSKTFADWNCENSDSDFRFALDRFNSDSSPVCEGRKHFNNSADETQPPNYFNHDDCFADQFVSKEKKIPWKSRTDATSSYDISPEKGDTHSHLNVSSSQMANDSLILQYQSNEHNFGCSQRSSFSDEIQTCERPKHFRNSDDETQAPSYFNHDDRFADLLVSEEDQIPRKLKNHATLSYDISPDKSATDFHLGVSSPDMANDSVLIKDPPNQHSFGCVRRSKLSKGRARSCSAPPFYRGKRKFPVLNEPLTKLTAQATAPVPGDITRVNATQPIPETSSSEFSAIHFGLRENVKTFEETCSGGLENSTTPLTKWRNDSDQNAVQHALELPHASFECYDDVLSVSSGPLHLSCSSLVPESIDKNCFEEGRVLLQLDKKFIPVMSGETLLLVDQHAADERIRLEELRRKVLSDEDRGITYFDSEEDLALPETGFQLLQKYTEQIQQWGWIINNSSVSSESFKRNMNILRRQARVVTLAAVPCILGVNLTGKDLMDFIQQLDESDGSSSIPPAIFRILNFKACRGAIMFGDPLLPTECCLIIEQLKATSLCFQCAHGRPTTVPIVNLANLRDELAKLEMLSGRRQEETWHGLSYHGPSLERAQTRLKRLRRLRRGL